MADAGLPQALLAVAGQIEQHPVPGAAGKEALAVRVVLQEAVKKLRANLIGRLAYGGADDGGDRRAVCAQGFHCVQSGFEHAVAAAAPACVRRPDDPGLRIGKQHRLTIGGQNGKTESGGRCDQRIGARAWIKRCGQHDDIGGMHLIDRDQMRQRQVHRLRHPGAVDGHGIAQVAAAGPAVQPRKNARRGPALAGKEPVPGTRKGVRGDDFQHVRTPAVGALCAGAAPAP